MTKDEVINRAKGLAKENDWTWLEPISINISIEIDRKVWEVYTNCYDSGTNISLSFDDKTGEIVHQSYWK